MQGEVQKWTPREVQHWLASVGLGEHAYNLEGMAGQVPYNTVICASQIVVLVPCLNWLC